MKHVEKPRCENSSREGIKENVRSRKIPITFMSSIVVYVKKKLNIN